MASKGPVCEWNYGWPTFQMLQKKYRDKDLLKLGFATTVNCQRNKLLFKVCICYLVPLTNLWRHSCMTVPIQYKPLRPLHAITHRTEQPDLIQGSLRVVLCTLHNLHSDKPLPPASDTNTKQPVSSPPSQTTLPYMKELQSFLLTAISSSVAIH